MIELAGILAAVGREVRTAVGVGPLAGDEAVVRAEGGDEVFAVDARADKVLVEELKRRAGGSFPGTLVIEGYDEPVPIGDTGGPWRYLADPVDGSRPWLAGKRSAWVLLGAGREAATLADLEVGACVELPTARAAIGLVAFASRDAGPPRAVDDDLVGDRPPRPRELRPRSAPGLSRAYVSVQRFAPGQKARIGAWEDALLGDVETYEDPYLCSGGQLLEVAMGRESAVLDPRPLLVDGMSAHPYDLAAWVVAAQAGVIVEALPPGPLAYPLDTTTPCAWAAYANGAVAVELRGRLAALTSRRARSAPARPGTR